jgi:hypothetical protein
MDEPVTGCYQGLIRVKSDEISGAF